MREEPHVERVHAWLARCVDARSPAQCVDALQGALDALSARARLTLGDVTLSAVVDRVLFNTTEKFPTFVALHRAPDGRIDCEGLRKNINGHGSAELIPAVRYLLVELLTILGRLTAEILTPALHADLARLEPASRAAQKTDQDEDASS